MAEILMKNGSDNFVNITNFSRFLVTYGTVLAETAPYERERERS